MPYSKEIVSRARQRLAQRKEEKASVYRAHLRIAYEKLPQLQNIDRQLSASMALAAKAAFTDGTDAAEALQQVRQANLALQQQRKQLIAEAFEEGFLDDSPVCTVCGGSGYIGTQMCDCLQALCRHEQKQQLKLLCTDGQTFENFRLDYYSDVPDRNYGASPRDIMQKVLCVCKRYAQEFSENSGNLLFIGNTGLGKTFLGACIACAVAEKGFCVAYESASNLFAKLEKNRFNPDEESQAQVQKLAQCDLLIIDDLGTELPGSFVTAALYSLINDRLLAQKSMVISTNLNIDEAARRYSPQIASRLQGSFKRLTFVGEDIRVLKNRAKP